MSKDKKVKYLEDEGFVRIFLSCPDCKTRTVSYLNPYGSVPMTFDCPAGCGGKSAVIDTANSNENAQ